MRNENERIDPTTVGFVLAARCGRSSDTVTRSRSGVITAALLLATLIASSHGRGATPDSEPQPLRGIAAVLALPPDAFAEGRTVVVTGTVTLNRAGGFFVIQDGEDGIFVVAPPKTPVTSGPDGQPHAAGVRLGSIIEVAGMVRASHFAPVIVARSIRVVGEGGLPDPLPVDMRDFFEGIETSKRVVLRGTVQAVHERAAEHAWELTVRSSGHDIGAKILKADLPGLPRALVDAEVEVIGVVGSDRNDRREFLGPLLNVARRDDLTVTAPAPGSPFDAERVALDALARFRRSRRGGHRVCTEAVVSLALPDVLFVIDGEFGVRVDLETGGDQMLHAPGDRVEISGFVTMARGIAGLREATVRKIGSETPPEPVPINAADIFLADEKFRRFEAPTRAGNFDGRLIRCPARLEMVDAVTEERRLLLSAGGRFFSASLPAGMPLQAFAPPLLPGSDLELTGIVQLDYGGAVNTGGVPELMSPLQLSLLLGGPANVVVLRSPPWWNPTRLAIAAATLAGVAAAAGIWVAMLRREVRRQAALAETETAARRQNALEYEIALRERNRLAVDLHDTVLQSVTGIGFQLHACEETRATVLAAPGRPQEAGPDQHLTAARHMVEQVSDQLRNAVRSLRMTPPDGVGFSAALKDAVARLREGHGVEVGLAIDATADQLPAFIGGSLLQIVKEAIHNSLQHAAPRRIDVRVRIDTVADTVTATVVDDGSGFEPGRQPGQADGHFGLTGMRERAGEIGGSLTIRSAPGAGTMVCVAAPLAGPSRH